MDSPEFPTPGRLPSPPLSADDIELAAVGYAGDYRSVALHRALSSASDADPLLLKSRIQTDEAVIRHRKSGKKAVGHFYSLVDDRTRQGDRARARTC